MTLGRRFQDNIHDVIDDRIDVVFRGTQGLTVSCARCHDHKYDPIPTKDYYSMYGVFANSTDKTISLVGADEDSRPYAAYDAELKNRERKAKAFLEQQRALLLPQFRRHTARYLLAAHASQMLKPIVERDLHLVMVERWRAFLEKRHEKFDPVFQPWFEFEALPPQDFTTRARTLSAGFASKHESGDSLNPLVAQLFAEGPPASLEDLANSYGRLFAMAEGWQESLRSPDQALPDANQEQIRQVMFGKNAPTNVPMEGKPGIETFFDEDASDHLRALEKSIFEWIFKADAPAHALIVDDETTSANPHVFLRGNPQNQGDEVTRQPPLVLAGEQRKPFQLDSGRRELAEIIASKNNPLTARVMVNRVWQHIIGNALVRTPSDFGMRSEPPTHPGLLDYLAWQFMEDEWSVKKLIRTIMLSNTYQQSTNDRPDCRAKDPDNRLMWRMNRRRLDFEAMRDAMLAVSRNIDYKMGGRRLY